MAFSAVVRPAVEIRVALLCRGEQLADEVAFGPEVHAAAVRRVARVEQRKAVVVFLHPYTAAVQTISTSDAP